MFAFLVSNKNNLFDVTEYISEKFNLFFFQIVFSGKAKQKSNKKFKTKVLCGKKKIYQNLKCESNPRELLTLVFMLPWMTTGRLSWTMFLIRTLSVPNFSKTSSARK